VRRVVIQRSLAPRGYRGSRLGRARACLRLATGEVPTSVRSGKGWAAKRIRRGDPVGVKRTRSGKAGERLRKERLGQAGPEEVRARRAGPVTTDGAGNYRIPLGDPLVRPRVAPHWRVFGRLQGIRRERFVATTGEGGKGKSMRNQ